MNTEHNEDMRKARMYLQMDDRELANMRAEHEKYERRKAAMQRGDTGSPLAPCESVSFAPLPCTGCDVLLTRSNHGNGQQCQRCLDEDQSFKRYEESRARYVAELDKKAARAFWPAMGWAVAMVAGAVLLALSAAWAFDGVAWAIGGAMP